MADAQQPVVLSHLVITPTAQWLVWLP